MKIIRLCLSSICIFLNFALLPQELQPPGSRFILCSRKHPQLSTGILDDAVWQSAPSVTGFKTWRPDFGKAAAEETIVYFAYDRENLFLAFRCLDSQPDKIKSSVSSRDSSTGDDWVCVNLDTFNDQQSLHVFYCNPLASRAIPDSRVIRKITVWIWSGSAMAEWMSRDTQWRSRSPSRAFAFPTKNRCRWGLFSSGPYPGCLRPQLSRHLIRFKAPIF